MCHSLSRLLPSLKNFAQKRRWWTPDLKFQDPKVDTRPWTMKFPIRAQQGQDIMEFECIEGERDLQHYVK